MPSLFALLVGINDYPAKPLAGCINDVEAMAAYLEDHCKRSGMTPHLLQLTDKGPTQPTRTNLIEAFHHFDLAQAGDYCLFYYSGHGSFAPAPPEFHTESDGAIESFVCIDSRTAGGRDLMDKEMGYLLWKTFHHKTGVQVVVITDCCHSGTITKGVLDNSAVTDRMMGGNNVPASIQQFLGYGDTVNGQQGYVVAADGSRVTVRQTNHIHIAASRDNQTAKELVIDGKRRGAFTHSLLKTLYATGGHISYAALIRKTAAAVKYLVADQVPDILINGSLPQSEADKQFLSHSDVLAETRFLVFHDPNEGWCVQAGPAQGVTPRDTVVIEGLCAPKVLKTLAPHLSSIESKMALGVTQNTYYATVERQPNQAVRVSFGPELGQPLQHLLLMAAVKEHSPFVVLTNEPGNLVLHARADKLFISQPGSVNPLFEPLPVTTEAEALYFLERVELVARWMNLKALENHNTRFNQDHYTLSLYSGNALTPNHFDLVRQAEQNDYLYQTDGSTWHQPLLRLCFTNRSTMDLWFGCAHLGFDYGIDAAFYPPERITPGESAWLTFSDGGLANDVIPLQVDQRYLDRGYRAISEYLKVFIGTEKPELHGLSQPGVDLPLAAAKSANDFMYDRGLGSGASHFTRNDWTTETIGLHIVWPMAETTLLPGTDNPIEGISIKPPAAFSATAVLSSSQTATRSTGGIAAPHRACHNTQLAPFHLGMSTRSDTVLDVLELFEVSAQSREAVSNETPLLITLPATTRAAVDENILPIGYDPTTGLYFPLGYTNAEGAVVIHTLPEETASDPTITTRSFGGSIKIYFQKVLNRVLGTRYDFPRLAMPTVDNEGNVQYDSDQANLRNAVAKASNILLFLHGIIGDTQTIVPCIRTEMEHGSTLEKAYDLVLSFDYENLNTPINETAKLLGVRLASIGLEQGHSKRLTIAAHSMGGLVSRWFIEKEGGNKVVQQLVMFGTPNNGSHWADVRDLAETLLTYALNGAAFLKPWMFVLSGMGKLAKGLQITLQQMDAETGIYTRVEGSTAKLNDGTDPGIPYTIIAGNTQQIVVRYEQTASLIGRLLKKVRGRGVYTALDQLLFKQPNDIAVTVASISGIPGSANWQYPPAVHTAASDHLNYFTYSELLLRLQFSALYQANTKAAAPGTA